jgi:hypothetical protein
MLIQPEEEKKKRKGKEEEEVNIWECWCNLRTVWESGREEEKERDGGSEYMLMLVQPEFWDSGREEEKERDGGSE